MRILFAPLRETHPLVTGTEVCQICGEKYHVGQRVTLFTSMVSPIEADSVPAIPVHAACAFVGMRFHDDEGKMVKIVHIKDGDASPYPIVTEDGRDLKVEEIMEFT